MCQILFELVPIEHPASSLLICPKYTWQSSLLKYSHLLFKKALLFSPIGVWKAKKVIPLLKYPFLPLPAKITSEPPSEVLLSQLFLYLSLRVNCSLICVITAICLHFKYSMCQFESLLFVVLQPCAGCLFCLQILCVLKMGLRLIILYFVKLVIEFDCVVCLNY